MSLRDAPVLLGFISRPMHTNPAFPTRLSSVIIVEPEGDRRGRGEAFGIMPNAFGDKQSLSWRQHTRTAHDARKERKRSQIWVLGVYSRGISDTVAGIEGLTLALLDPTFAEQH